MPKQPKEKGDFGLPRRAHTKNNIVGIFDLVGFTDLQSNKDLIQAVKTIETQIELICEPEYYWDERIRGGSENDINTILLRSTGDGYIIAFSQRINDLDALNHLTKIHTNIKRNHYPVRLGINKGENYIVKDMNDRVNIIGWGINLAARAVQFAGTNQIICTSHFAEPLIQTHGDVITENEMINIGVQKVKDTTLQLYNYYKKDEFGESYQEKEE